MHREEVTTDQPHNTVDQRAQRKLPLEWKGLSSNQTFPNTHTELPQVSHQGSNPQLISYSFSQNTTKWITGMAPFPASPQPSLFGTLHTATAASILQTCIQSYPHTHTAFPAPYTHTAFPAPYTHTAFLAPYTYSQYKSCSPIRNTM